MTKEETQIVVTKDGKLNLSEISKGTNDFKVDIKDIIKNVPIDKISKIPNCCGAYIITFKSGKIYVGKSKNVRTRPLQHKSKKADEFKGEIMDKVSAYITNNYKDAGVLEALFIRQLPVINKEHQSDASTWKNISKEQLLSSNPKELKDMLNKLSDKILSLPDVKEKAVPSGWITYQISAGKNFCIIWVKKGHLLIDLKIDENNFKDINNLSVKIPWTTSQAFNRRIKMSDDKQLDSIFNLVRQAYQCMCEYKNKK